MRVDWAKLRSECDAAIRAGHGQVARELLEGIETPEIPRDFAVIFGALARRANAPGLGLKILRTWVRAPEKAPVRPRPAEQAEYAAGLLRIGAVAEAEALLAQVPEQQAPEALLFTAFAFFKRWDYAQATPLLERYVRHAGLGEYARLVGEVNLAACHVFTGKTAQARSILSRVLRACQSGGHSLLQGNVLEYLAQAAIAERDWGTAEDLLARAALRISGSGSLDELFVRKWRAVASLLQHPRSRARARDLLGVREDAVRMRHGETVRDCDQYLVIARRDRELLAHLWFGTPYPAFRAKLAERLGGSIELPNTYTWRPTSPWPSHAHARRSGEPARHRRHLIQLQDLRSHASGLIPGQVPHRLLLALARDFYQPSRVAALHSLIFPGEYFHPQGSSARVHQALLRLRQVISRENWDLQVSEQRGDYSLCCGPELELQVALSEAPLEAPPDVQGRRIEVLRARFGVREFRAREAAEALGLSERGFQRLATQEPSLLRLGSARATRYLFV